jgi:hypothetical protein
MPYTHFRFVAYQVPTAAKDQLGNVISSFNAGWECPDNDILPITVSANTPDDARIRLKRLAAVVTQARHEIANGMHDDRNTLKVFMVPEFYFRPDPTASPFYRSATYYYDHAMKVLEEMNTMFVHPEFRDWLFVLGSVMWNWSAGGNITYRNSAPYVVGDKVDSLRIVEKAVPSRLDGVPNPYVDIKGMERYDREYEIIFADWSSRRGHVFDIDGVTCGLEVCLDHPYTFGPDYKGRVHRILKTVLSDWGRNERKDGAGNARPPPSLALHLLTAGGMTIDTRSIAAMPRGFILRNDGFNPTPQVQMKRVLSYQNAAHQNVPPSDLDGTADLFELRPERVVGVDLNGFLAMPVGCTSFYQGLVFYPSLALPQQPALQAAG